MRTKMVKAIFKKEMIDILRDKKTLFMGIILPIILYPVLMIVMSQILTSSMHSVNEKSINIAFQNEPKSELLQVIDEYKNDENYKINIIKSSDYNKELEKGEIDAYIKNLGEESYEVYLNSSKENYSMTMNKLESIFGNYEDKLVKENLQNEGLDAEQVLNPVVFKSVDVAKTEEIAGFFLGQILPIILIMGVLLGSIYPAIDSMAGEKERGTLETLFTLPISNLELVMGKYMAVSFCSIVTAILNVISILLTMVYLFVSGSMVSSSSINGIDISQLIFPIIITLVCVCLFAMVISAVSMCVCSFAKSFKDAQNYMTPIMFLVLIPSYASMLPNMSLNYTTSIIPVVNISLLIKSVLNFESNIGLVAMVFISNFAFVILAVILLSKIFNSEDILFGSSKSFSFLEKRSNIKKGTMPSSSDGIVMYAFGLLMLIYVGSLVQIKFGMGGIVMTQIMILGIPILFGLYIKSDFKKLLRLNLPKGRHVVGAITLWIGTYNIVMIITQILLSLFPQNMQVVEGLNEVLFMDNLLVNLAIVALMPAICEEVFFRGFLLSSLSNDKTKYMSAIVVSGVLFGFMHMDFIRIVPTSILGISFAYAVYKSNSIFIGMLMHFINNGFAVVVNYFMTKFGLMEITLENSNSVATLEMSQIMIVSAIGIFFLLISYILFEEKTKIKNI
ncbi:MAG: ABC transporter permease subunit/CPBP intramembrane protease [Peptostreptococcaceae bacterium]